MNDTLKKEQQKNEIMRRVKTVYFLRKVTQPLFIELLLLTLSFGAVSFMVSIPHVLRNLSMLPALPAYAAYLFEAFIKTQTIVQLTLVFAFIALILVIVDLGRNIRHTGFSRTI